MKQMGVATINDDGDVVDKDDKVVVTAVMGDWKDAPHDVAERLNDVLSDHGLELVEYDTESDQYMFSLQKKA